MSDKEYHGHDRRKKTEAIHPWRWRFLALWIIGFTVLAFIALRANRSQIVELNRTKADVQQLIATNCALREFLLQAAETRTRAASRETGPERAVDLQAAKAYLRLADTFGDRACVR